MTPTTATRPAAPADDGFTLVELLVVVLLLGIVGAMVLTSVVRGMEVGQRGQNRVEAIAELQRGAEEIARELRVADTGTGGDPFLSFADSDVLVDVRRDMDGDGIPETVRHRFVVSGGDLLHCQQTYTPPGTPCTGTPAGRPVVENVTGAGGGPIFTLLDENGASLPATATADASGVQIDLVRQLRYGADIEDATVRTTVSLRNQ